MLWFQGGKAQIIGPEEEEEDDCYSFNEVSHYCYQTFFFLVLFLWWVFFVSILVSLSFSFSLSVKMDGPFQDIELLKSRPAHMTVFMRYIFSQLLDPNPLVSVSFSVWSS